MKQYLIAAAVAVLASPAFAFQCPADMAEIDAALAAGTDLNEEQLAEVMDLRAEGERLHGAGEHQASVDALHKALELLGLTAM
ncbi:hypothetical protein [Sinisalibacter aestuarii]|uniref:Uncharacterized protein n=1 Tax=Sinisalibacter aestuarii TaxID=2949426 RepID=A0ABQ5LWW5_9RHOB|nr:hypothetical protein [Sinisalibacter aestuarii]GKY88885.1 hypothetical protein STA1M1_27540 [Sinisalibacter aestuarii]